MLSMVFLICFVFQGGKDLRKRSRMLDREGQEVSGSKGYKYFGAARELPGVRELFDAAPVEQSKKTRYVFNTA
jgi:pre-mRNA-splicing factor ISY1